MKPDFSGLRRSMRRLLAAAALLVLPAVLSNPVGAQSAAEIAIPSGTTYQKIGTYDLTRLDRILGAELQDFMSASTEPDAFKGRFPAARYPVSLYRVRYNSVVPELGNRPTVASGLVAVPETGSASMPVLSYQHGTVFEQNAVPSHPDQSSETRIMVARFAAQGYVVIGADYFGRGDSTLPDSYLVKASTQQATVDMLSAARSVLSALGIAPTKLFVSGWSQGGWATMAYLQKLEQTGVPVTAAAVASGPVDVALAVNRWLNNPQPVDAVYLPGVLSLQLQSYAYYHQRPGFDAVAIRSEFLAAARDLYAGRIDFTTFATRTPKRLQDFVNPEFRATVALGEGAYWRALDEDQAYRWRLKTPLRTWYGGSDEVTPDYIGKLPQQTQALLGGAETRAIDAGPKADHRGVFIQAVLDQKNWFDGLLAP